MTATSRQITLLRRPLGSRPKVVSTLRRALLGLLLVLSGLLWSGRLRAAPVAVVARQSDHALAASAQPALLAAVVPTADVAAPQPRLTPLPLLPAPPTALPPRPAVVVLAVSAAGQPGGPAHRWVTACRTSEVPNGP